jgi:hypothetical protein
MASVNSESEQWRTVILVADRAVHRRGRSQ